MPLDRPPRAPRRAGPRHRARRPAGTSFAAVPVAAVIVAAVLVAASCAGGGGDDDGRDGVRPATSPPTAATTAAPTTTATAAPATTTMPPAPDLTAVRIALEPVVDGLDSPVALAWRAGDDRMYVAEQHRGQVRIVDRDVVLDEPVLDLDVSDGNEQGLLGLAFSADGGTLYVDFTDPSGDTHVDAYTMDGDRADVASRREVLFVEQPYANHNGGQLLFGPDGMLYVTVGDGGGAGDPHGHAQDLGSLLGTVLRIDPAPVGDSPYAVPADNPFVEDPQARTEVWMYGLRNPWRMSFDAQTGDVWVADVGQDAYEELNVAAPPDAPGANWGWPAREGRHEYAGPAPAGARDPVLELSHGDGNCSITGGYVYRGETVESLRGVYVFADHCRGELTGVVQRDGVLVEARELGVRLDDVTTFGESPDGEILVASRGGTVARIVAG